MNPLFFLLLLTPNVSQDENLLLSAHRKQKPLLVAGVEEGYLNPDSCKPCHLETYQNYQHTGMGQSFYRMNSKKEIEDWTHNSLYYHRPSDRYYKMSERNGRYYQRRYQIGFAGKEVNVVEKEIHFVVGSGKHSRTYLHHSPKGELSQLPISWYNEKGGFWAMSPGYDSPSHYGFQRKVTYGCIFCHNSYPEIVSGADGFGQESLFKGNIPEGIDCQRCHGPGKNHVIEAKKPNAKVERIRTSIQNPGRMEKDRQMEVCMQCHLETTSARLPHSIQNFGRNTFSYRPGEPLSDYITHFDHAPGKGYDDKFLIVNAPYRLFQSPCFKKSKGALTCLTCHNPHNIPRGEIAQLHYNKVCLNCHRSNLEKLITSQSHTSSLDCLPCHMPKRRTDDVIHVVMTDHRIQRVKPKRNLLAPLAEKSFWQDSYNGEVLLYYPKTLSAQKKDLYESIAQVQDKSNLKIGIQRLEKALKKYKPKESQFYYELAEAYFENKQIKKSIHMYEEALRLNPNLSIILHRMGVALTRLGELSRAARVLKKASKINPKDGAILNDLALVLWNQGETKKAIQILKTSVKKDPERSESHSNLGVFSLAIGKPEEAKMALREAIRLEPDLPTAHHNLASVLFSNGNFSEADYQFEKTIEYNPTNVKAYLDYSVTLAQRELYEKAHSNLKKALELDPALPETHNMLGEVLAAKGELSLAKHHLLIALNLKPSYAHAHLNYGTILALSPKTRKESIKHFEKAAKSPEISIRQTALAWLKKILDE